MRVCNSCDLVGSKRVYEYLPVCMYICRIAHMPQSEKLYRQTRLHDLLQY